MDNAGVLRVSGQMEVTGSSAPPDRYLNLPDDSTFVLYLGTTTTDPLTYACAETEIIDEFYSSP